MNKYVGVKLVEAELMSFGEYVLSIHKDEPSAEESLHKGYKVTYPDGYVSWSPKDVFEKAYYKLSDPEGNRIVKEDVENFIAGNYTGSKVGLKTSCITATLKSGYEITESSSCVDPHYFDYAIGEKICLEKISDKVWALLGFLLQCGKYGMK